MARTLRVGLVQMRCVPDDPAAYLARASSAAKEALVVDCDLALIEERRRGWPFLRDRRIDAYGDLTKRFRDWRRVIQLAIVVVSSVAIVGGFAAAANVTVAGDFQSELGCPSDWQPDCALTHLAFDASDGVWQANFALPSGSFSYKVAIDDSWTESHPDTNRPLAVASPSFVTFFYDPATHWVADDANDVIATVAGDFQSELGCPGDFQPECLLSWLKDPDGDGVYIFSTSALPAGDYQGKVAINQNWSENYGIGGAPSGANYSFHLAALQPVAFAYDPATHLLAIETPEPGAAAGALAAIAALLLRRCASGV